MTIMEARLKPDYNCAHFVADAWEAEGLGSIRETLSGFLFPVGKRSVRQDLADNFTRLEKPISPCIVLFRQRRAAPHVGLYIRGRVFHLTDNGPVRQLLDIAAIGYLKTRFYAVRPLNH